MHNSAISIKKVSSQLVATSKPVQISLIFSGLLVRCNKGSLVEQQVSRENLPM